MNFITDKQTLEDLNIQGRHKNNSVQRLFDHTLTAGGSGLMELMFQRPLTDPVAINKRSAVFRFFTDTATSFPFGADDFEQMENYLRSASGGNLLSGASALFSAKVLQLVAQDSAYDLLLKDVLHAIKLLNQFDDFSRNLQVGKNPYAEELEKIRNIFNHPELAWLRKAKGLRKLSFSQLIRYDYQLRGGLKELMQQMTDLIFHLDVYIAVAEVARLRGFQYALALPHVEKKLMLRGLYHPALENAKGNALSLNREQNVLFLTGANMAGKSTLMKSVGIAVYLGHMGFPVAAEDMEFSVKDGLYTSINVPDSLAMGHSHFYAEVLRVKMVAEEVASGKNLLVIFDELFKGTNVKDAYDGTLSITKAFSEIRDCFFVISSHIIEVAASLCETSGNFSFAYMPTVMEGNIPRYTYELSSGITTDKQGMTIIRNEGILEILSLNNSITPH